MLCVRSYCSQWAFARHGKHCKLSVIYFVFGSLLTSDHCATIEPSLFYVVGLHRTRMLSMCMCVCFGWVSLIEKLIGVKRDDNDTAGFGGCRLSANDFGRIYRHNTHTLTYKMYAQHLYKWQWSTSALVRDLLKWVVHFGLWCSTLKRQP